MKKVAIIGSGPAGMFCADALLGLFDITIFESGNPIDQRVCPELDCKCEICDILEGEGGAGGMSDGKNTYSIHRGTQMEDIFTGEDEHWIKYIDQVMVRHAGKGVWYDPAKPPKEFKGSPLEFTSYPLRHVGSDGIREFVKGFTRYLRHYGIKMEHSRATPLFSDSLTKVLGVEVDYDNQLREFDYVILAVGLQGIPYVEKLMTHIQSPMMSGPAGFGIRIEMEADIVAWLHERFYDYKIILDHKSGITLRSFCCNANGSVINERHTDLDIINVNGHSFLDPERRTQSSNMALIAKIEESRVTVSPQMFVRSVARAINQGASGSAYQPLMEFMGDRTKKPFVESFRTNPQAKRFGLSMILQNFGLLGPFQSFIHELDKIVPIISQSSLVYAPEIKYYGRRMNVTSEWRSRDVPNLFVIGSASGYLDSFVAAALSGIIAAESIKEEVT